MVTREYIEKMNLQVGDPIALRFKDGPTIKLDEDYIFGFYVRMTPKVKENLIEYAESRTKASAAAYQARFHAEETSSFAKTLELEDLKEVLPARMKARKGFIRRFKEMIRS